MSELHQYRSLKGLIEAVRSGEVPVDVLSPAEVAKILGVTRQAVHQRCYVNKTLESWVWKGVIFISKRSVQEALRKKRKVPEGQHELQLKATD